MLPQNEIQDFLHHLDEGMIITRLEASGGESVLFVNDSLNNFIGPQGSGFGSNFDFKKYVLKEDQKRFAQFFLKILEAKDKQKIQLRITEKGLNFLWVELSVYFQIKENSNNILYVLRGIDNEIQSEQLLKQSELKHRLLFTKANDAIFIIQNLQIVDCNEKTLEMFDSPGYSGISGKQLYNFMPEKQEDGSDSILNFHLLILETLNGKSNFFSWTFSKFSGTQFDTEVSLSAFYLGSEQFIQVIVRDITARKKAEQEALRAKIAEKANLALQKEIQVRIKTEEQLKTAQKYTKNIIESSLDTIVASDKEGRITDFNHAASKAFGFSSTEAIGMGAWKLFLNREQSDTVLKEILLTGFYTGEILCITKSGDNFIGYLSASLLKNDKGLSVGTVGVVKDITYLKKSEQELKKNVEQKEVLIKEVHHRVKNNLQVINSILKLQSVHIADKKALMAIKECQDRIKSMAFIHESLYQSNDLAKVNFSEYLKTLCNNLLYSYQSTHTKIDLMLDVNEVSLSLDSAISCGLIVNELFSNALKYAFKDQKTGEIKVSLNASKREHILIVQDNGVGIAKSIDYKNSPSLGFQLVLGLVDQIDGKISLNSAHGTQFIIKFKRR